MKKILLAVAVCAVVLTTGCADKPEPVASVRISPTIKTRVTGLHFDTGDRIGLTITKASGPFVQNRMMTYDGSSFTSQGLLWYNDLRETSTLTAYYPYAEGGAPAEFSIATDQRAGCASSDLLGAVKTGVTPGSAPVGMLFYHLMSQLSILVTNNSDAAVSEITVGGFAPTATVDFNIPTAVVKTGAAAADVRVFTVTPDAVYRAVLVPQQGALTVTVFTDDGKNRSKTISAAQLESGKRYDLSVEVTNIDIVLSLSGEINDWQDGGSLDNGGGQSGGEDIVDDGTLEYGGESYRTVTVGEQVWMAENLRYIPEGKVVGENVWYPAGGAATVASQGLLYDYATATGGTAARSAAPVRGICPPGWHLPAADELTALIQSGERPADFFCCGGFWKVGVSTGYGADNTGYLLGATLQDTKCSSLYYTSIAGGSPEIRSVSTAFGLTVRCVRDAR